MLARRPPELDVVEQADHCASMSWRVWCVGVLLGALLDEVGAAKIMACLDTLAVPVSSSTAAMFVGPTPVGAARDGGKHEGVFGTL